MDILYPTETVLEFLHSLDIIQSEVVLLIQRNLDIKDLELIVFMLELELELA